MESTQKEVVTKSITYPADYLGCTVTLGGCIALGNNMYSDLMNIVHPDTAGNHNLIRGTVETGVKAAGVPKEYQGIFTDIGYFGVNTVLVGLGDWETIGNKLSNIKLPSLGQAQTEIEIAGIGKVKVDDLDEFNSKKFEASKNKGNGSSTISNNNPYSGELIKVSKEDIAADALAERIGGESRVRFANDPQGREFDVINDEYIAQAKPALKTFNKDVRNQMKATFETAKLTNKKVYYQFEGEPSQSVIRKLQEYSERYGIEVIIDTKPLMK